MQLGPRKAGTSDPATTATISPWHQIAADMWATQLPPSPRHCCNATDIQALQAGWNCLEGCLWLWAVGCLERTFTSQPVSIASDLLERWYREWQGTYMFPPLLSLYSPRHLMFVPLPQLDSTFSFCLPLSELGPSSRLLGGFSLWCCFCYMGVQNLIHARWQQKAETVTALSDKPALNAISLAHENSCSHWTVQEPKKGHHQFCQHFPMGWLIS